MTDRPMICQRCSAEATVHLTESIDGTTRELHFCAECARLAGVPVTSVPPSLGLQSVVEALIVAHVGELVGELARRVCPDCGLTFREFRVLGQLGCPRDYETFAPGLVPLLRRSHGASRHVGKAPRRRRLTVSTRLHLRALLRDAVSREDYEAAASYRDQLRGEDPDE